MRECTFKKKELLMAMVTEFVFLIDSHLLSGKLLYALGDSFFKQSCIPISATVRLYAKTP